MHKTLLFSVLACTGCVVADEPALGTGSQSVTRDNGISLNGISLNGISLNGISLNGISLNGISLNGTSLSGVAIGAGSTSGPPLSGSSMIGSTWTATAVDGTPVKLRIDDATQGSSPNSDLWFYAVSYQTQAGWSPLCGLDDVDQVILAVPVAGVWRSTDSDDASYGSSTTQFTFACRGKTIAKCVELGYKPYKGRSTHLAACVRLLRGDFCGTGVAYTVDGTTLNLYDRNGVQTDTKSWAPEAEWTPDGARCVNSNNNARYELVLSYDPRCVRRIKSSTCGQSFSDGALLIDELPEAHTWDGSSSSSSWSNNDSYSSSSQYESSSRTSGSYY
jgi:hypothetical protein